VADIRILLRTLSPLLMTTLLLAPGCSGGDAGEGTGRVEILADGTRQVTHHRLPDRVIALDTLAVLDLYGPQNDYPFSQSVAAIGTEETFLMIDRNGAVVVEVDLDGRILRTIGHNGGGPGEFQRPNWLVLRQDTIWVQDGENRRVSRFTRDGRFVGDFTWAAELGPPGEFDVLDGGGFLYRTERVVLDTLRVVSLARLDPEQVPVDTLATLVTDAFHRVVLHSHGYNIPVMSPPIFAPYLWWDTHHRGQGAVVAASDQDYVIERFSLDGRRRLRVVGPLLDLPVSQKDKNWWFEIAYPETAIGITLGRMDIHPTRQELEAFTFAERRQAVRMVRIDPLNRLWVLASTVDPAVHRVDIFSAEGSYLGHLPEGSGLPQAFLADGRALLYTEMEDGSRNYFVARPVIP
jgi:hypothetical protein